MSNIEFYRLLRKCREYCHEHGPIGNDEKALDLLGDEGEEILLNLTILWRRVGSPPTYREVGTVLLSRIRRRYGTLTKARSLAKARLSEKEVEEMGWRCRHCEKDGFPSASARGVHERTCKNRVRKVKNG